MGRDLLTEEEDWWDSYMDRIHAAEDDAMRAAESYAEMYEFDSESERDEYIAQKYGVLLDELLA